MKIAIAGDGNTDREVFKNFVQKFLKSEIQESEITFLYRCPNGQQVFDILKKNKEPDFLKNEITKKFCNAIHAGYKEWNQKTEEEITWNDIFIYHLDTERVIKINREEDIVTGWAREILEAVWRGVDLFYFRWGGYYSSLYYLPKVFPVVCFPSTEVIIGACKGIEIRNIKAHELKNKLYGTSDLRNISEREFHNKLESIFPKDKEKLLELLRKVPEIYRLLFLITF